MAARLRSVAALLSLFAFVVAAPSAAAANGGTSVPANPPTVLMGQDTGGVAAGPNVAPPKVAAPPKTKARAVMPTLTSFSLGATRFSDGQGLPVAFKMAGTTGAVRVKLGIYSGGHLRASFDLGRRSTGLAQHYTVSAASAKRLPAGSLILKLSGT